MNKQYKGRVKTIKRQTAIRDYFAKRVGCYEAVYSKKNLRGLHNTIYWLGWFPLRLIFRYTIKYLAGVKPQSVLDIGCGTGVYSVELAARGIDVTGSGFLQRNDRCYRKSS